MSSQDTNVTVHSKDPVIQTVLTHIAEQLIVATMPNAGPGGIDIGTENKLNNIKYILEKLLKTFPSDASQITQLYKLSYNPKDILQRIQETSK